VSSAVIESVALNVVATMYLLILCFNYFLLWL